MARREREDETEASEAAGGFLAELPTLALAVAVALLIRAFLFQSFYVPSDSMFPTMLVGDHVFVNKLSYGPRIPLTEVRLPGFREPERGEVIVFQAARDGHGGVFPVDLRRDLRSDAFVKRLVGLPGDRVASKDGRVVLNGEPVPWQPTGRVFTDKGGRRFDVYVEELPGCHHYVLDDPRGNAGDMRETTVKPGRYLFMGDNRDNSYDGRRFGSVRITELEGPAGLLYWSWDFTGSWLSLLSPLTWWNNLTAETRWSRMGGFHECWSPGDPIPPVPENAE